MRPPRWLTLSFTLGLIACAKPFPCTRYCWSHAQVVPDATGPDGRFDASCTRSDGGGAWYPLMPQFGWYAAELCVDADVHAAVAKVVASIQDPTVDASQTCDLTDLQAYADLVQALAMQARDACVADITCNGVPAGCDLDPFLGGNQACTVPSAQTLCDQVVLLPALASLSDLSNGPGAAQPQRDGTAVAYVDDPAECQPLVQADTDDVPTCPEAPPAADGTTGADESGASGDG